MLTMMVVTQAEELRVELALAETKKHKRLEELHHAALDVTHGIDTFEINMKRLLKGACERASGAWGTDRRAGTRALCGVCAAREGGGGERPATAATAAVATPLPSHHPLLAACLTSAASPEPRASHALGGGGGGGGASAVAHVLVRRRR